MPRYILAYDLGTAGNKAALFGIDGQCVAEVFVPYETFYPVSGWHEQRPEDWWNAVVESTRRLLSEAVVDRNEIACIGISGQSLGVVPLDRKGNLLRERVPIWSDSRASDQSQRFFEEIDEGEWYLTTGNGFPPPLYSIFKIMWFRDREPEMFAQIHRIVGSKDFINYKLTGRIATDHSYASGCGIYDLKNWKYSERLLEASEVPQEIFPEPVTSSEVLGELASEASDVLGLPKKVLVVAGGVDNSCMALGARNTEEGRIYLSLGSSSWIAVSSGNPLLDVETRPYVFAHVLPGLFTSATSIFSAGTSFRWIRDNICPNLIERAKNEKADVYELMTSLAANAPVGSKKLLFNPSLAGGTMLDGSPDIRGAYIGIDLGHTQADLIRAAMEGIAMGLRLALDALRRLTRVNEEMVIVGGGGRSQLWRQICADVFGLKIIKTNIDQNAAALGAASVAAVGSGVWKDASKVDEIHRVEDISEPSPEHVKIYEQLLAVFKRTVKYHSDLGQKLSRIHL